MRFQVVVADVLGLAGLAGCSGPAPDSNLAPPDAIGTTEPPAGTDTTANYAQDIKADSSMQEACQTGAIGRCPSGS